MFSADPDRGGSKGDIFVNGRWAKYPAGTRKAAGYVRRALLQLYANFSGTSRSPLKDAVAPEAIHDTAPGISKTGAVSPNWLASLIEDDGGFHVSPGDLSSCVITTLSTGGLESLQQVQRQYGGTVLVLARDKGYRWKLRGDALRPLFRDLTGKFQSEYQEFESCQRAFARLEQRREDLREQKRMESEQRTKARRKGKLRPGKLRPLDRRPSRGCIIYSALSCAQGCLAGRRARIHTTRLCPVGVLRTPNGAYSQAVCVHI
ncbi:unnamed protein product [Sphagnum tenellum]